MVKLGARELAVAVVELGARELGSSVHDRHEKAPARASYLNLCTDPLIYAIYLFMNFIFIFISFIFIFNLYLFSYELMPPCKRVHAMTVTVYMEAGIRTGVAGSQANGLDHSSTTHRL